MWTGSRSLRLQAEPASAGIARRFVTEALRTAQRDRWVEPTKLAVSELVTNAVLHAHTPIELVIAISPTAATVHVRDWSRQLPVARHWGQTATTGRGLALVAATTTKHGMEVLADGGKVIWFEIDDHASVTLDPGRIPAEWDLDALLTEFPDIEGDLATPEPAPALLRRVPVILWLAGQQQYEAVLRELFLCPTDTLIAAAPGRLDLDAAARGLAMLSAAIDVARRAAGPDAATVDAALAVSPDDHATYAALPDALDVGFRLAASGQLLLRPSLPEIVGLRDWACEQILAQVNGVAPTPWSGVNHPRFADPAPHETLVAHNGDHRAIRESDRAVVAADDNNRIVAVSHAAGILLGWAPDVLTGRRIITIVPPRLREAHIAGFTRYLTTGQSVMLGTVIDLPVLRGDGTELLCRCLIEQNNESSTPALYLAWLTPADGSAQV
ncbi:MAG TPA: ATP-binding protein [Mycobacteriales bacterium]|jgi:PAS domain S-box-containing protein|nr:ATP-binding protein [Mycobacteriales bacterium]